jgi:small-conductance mechanosensitive channel
VRGVEALPAADRAASIARNITALATDRAFRPESLRVEDRGDASFIIGGQHVVMRMDDEDARLEGAQRSVLAPVYVQRIGRAIVEYREARTRAAVTAGVTRAAGAIAVTAILLVMLLWLLRRVEGRLQRAFGQRVAVLVSESERAPRVERLWATLRAAIGVVRVVAVLLVAFLLLEYALIQFPWTRSAGLRLLKSVARPLGGAGEGLVAAIPNLVVLALLFLATRFALAVTRLYFDALESGTVKLRRFEPEWARPSYNLVRVAIIASALVIAYPYIPGSQSDAFKGISILAGVLLSLGSTTAIGNIVGGYALLYRRAFRVGDRVKIGDVAGEVMEMRLQVTHVRTFTNEAITIPNSTILTSAVVNYSLPARQGRLILHTQVGIGYQAPWRQVEALLIEAARRTPHLLTDPPPFVLQRKLGEFAITYQINAYSTRADATSHIYAELHRNILDQFNEHGVQIMTPAYQDDPETPKLVAKEHWFATPGAGDAKALSTIT